MEDLDLRRRCQVYHAISINFIFRFFYIEARSIYKTSTYRAVNSISLVAAKLLILPIDDPPNQSF